MKEGAILKKGHFLKNFLFQSGYQLLTLIMPLITTPYISRILGKNNVGIYSYTCVIANYFVILAALGIESYGNRSIAKAKNKSQAELNKTFTGIFKMHFIVSLCSLFFYLMYSIFIAKEYRTILLLQSFLIIGALFDINWFFFGMEEFKLTVSRNVIVKILTICSIFIFVKTSSDLWKYVLIMSLGTFISQSVVWFFIPKYVSFTKVSTKETLQHFKPLLILFVAVIATTLYRMIDKTMIGKICDMGILGCYEYADQIIKMPVTLITALGTVMLPRMSSLLETKDNSKTELYLKSSFKFVFFLSFAIAFGLAAISTDFVQFFLGKGYEDTAKFIQVLVISIPFMGWNNLIRTQILIPKTKDVTYTKAVWAGAIVNVILNIILIYSIGAIGAAIATNFSYFIVSIMQTYPIRKEYPIKTYLSYGIVPLLTGVLMFILVKILLNKLHVTLFSFICIVFIGAFFYISMNLIYYFISKKKKLFVSKR